MNEQYKQAWGELCWGANSEFGGLSPSKLHYITAV